MSGYQPQNRLCHHKSYCKYSLLYEAVMGRTKDLNEVAKSLKSLIFSLCAAGKQRKDIASHVGCSKASVLCPPTDSFAGLPRPTGSRETSNSPRSGVMLWDKKSLLQPPFVVSGRWASVAANLQQNPCLTANRS